MTWKKGESGNLKGRPIKGQSELENLRLAIRIVRRQHGNKDILIHFIEQAYADNEVLKVLINKLIPSGGDGAKILLQNINNNHISTGENGRISAEDSQFRAKMREHLRNSLQQLP